MLVEVFKLNQQTRLRLVTMSASCVSVPVSSATLQATQPRKKSLAATQHMASKVGKFRILYASGKDCRLRPCLRF